MPLNRQITFSNKTNAVSSSYGVNQKLTGAEMNDIRDKHNAVEADLEILENALPGINQNISNAQQQADNNALEIETNIDSIQDLQAQLGNHTVQKNVPANATFTDTLPDPNATNQGNTFNQSGKLLKLDNNGKVPENLIKGRLSCYKVTDSIPAYGLNIIDHYAPVFESDFVTVNSGLFYTMIKGHYQLSFSFDFVTPEIFTIRLLKNDIVIETNRCTHQTSFPIYVSNQSDKYTISVESNSQANLENIQVKILRS